MRCAITKVHRNSSNLELAATKLRIARGDIDEMTNSVET